MSKTTDRGAASGFTLIEILVALTILGIVLMTASQIFRGSVRGVGRAEDEARLAELAEAVWYELSLRGLRQVDRLDLRLPPGYSAELVEPTADEAAAIEEVATRLDHVRLRVVGPSGAPLELTGLMPEVEETR